MFKRRLAVLGAVAVLAITGLAGSAMADEPSPTAGTKVTCTTEDGKTIEMTPALPAKEGGKGGVVVGPDGKVTHLADSDTVQVEKLPDGGVAVKKAEPLSPEEAEKFSKVKKLSQEEIEKLVAAGDIVKAKPAEPAAEGGAPVVATAPGEDGPAKTVKIICKKPE
ncbi:unnamed protein product [[Actinomadura] parvosata subsp. kistnae]|uniref:Uncharacterized protein n=1 Tax=[Actinomadura] parvosata subsp. kistnae TaxID=1909395 RepID=A0A1V0ABY3_9ACTN|nr:hypothetical protein [Nonomuraea sp. ATCC 55076]AQZ67707.1 hypothetical protein BKM31_45160 [Nonomuraea sp. ATCC 55076]SPL94003.1 unnamed protein product [Actinomadura parvosata subsp. kistnae]